MRCHRSSDVQRREGKLSCDVDPQLLVAHPAGNGQKGAL